MGQKRKEFPERLKAEIFARDRATCCFTGKSLWIFDYGASPLWDSDWVDHIQPSSRGGSGDAANGVCASSWANSKKSNNSRDSAYFFREGRPTENFLFAVGVVSPAVQTQLERLSGIVASDWYLARAGKDVLLAVQEAAWPSGKKRTPDYWCGSAEKYLRKWRRRSEHDAPLEHRKVLLQPLDEDQRMFLRLRECATLADIRGIKRELVPWYRANWRAYDKVLTCLADLREKEDKDGGKSGVLYPVRRTRHADRNRQLTAALRTAASDPYVSRRLLRWLRGMSGQVKTTRLVYPCR